MTRSAIDMVNRRELNGLLALMAEDVEAKPLIAAIEGVGIYQGHDGLRQWWKSLFDGIPDFSAEVVEMRDYGDGLVLAPIVYRGHGEETATPFEETVWMAASWRQGECVWWGVFSTEAEALKAARGSG